VSTRAFRQRTRWRALLRWQLVLAWSDLAADIHASQVKRLDPTNERSGWSIGMLDRADRIASMTRAVGPVNWEVVQVDLLLDGWWEAVYRRAGLPVPPFDRERAEGVLARRVARRVTHGG
jgi:hypothetical protein